MGCGGGKQKPPLDPKAAAVPSAPQPEQQTPATPEETPEFEGLQGKKGLATIHSGAPFPANGALFVDAPCQSDAPFLRTASPNGMSWGQYVRGQHGRTFVDPATSFLAGPWAECIAWGVVYEHSVAWDELPDYGEEGVVWGIMKSFEKACSSHAQLMEAALLLEDAAQELAENRKPLPPIKQCAMLPNDAEPGQPCQVEHPQLPGCYQTVMCPEVDFRTPGHCVSTLAPVQPTATAKISVTSQGSKIDYAAGSKVTPGRAAGLGYLNVPESGWDGDWATNPEQDTADGAGGCVADATEWAAGTVLELQQLATIKEDC